MCSNSSARYSVFLLFRNEKKITHDESVCITLLRCKINIISKRENKITSKIESKQDTKRERDGISERVRKKNDVKFLYVLILYVWF